MWIKLKTVKDIEKAGKLVHHSPGDWVDVGKQLALRWVHQGDAEIMTSDVLEFIDSDTSGIVLLDHEEAGKMALAEVAGHVGVVCGTYELRWPKTLLWNPELPMRLELLPIGYHLLDTWQVAAPMYDYEVLARDVGEKEDKARTADLLHTADQLRRNPACYLAVPLLDWRMVFVNRCSDTDYLMNCWDEERVDSTDPFHSFLRAVYRAKPTICTLPTTWSDRGRGPAE